MMEQVELDIAIIGGGAAGLRAAIAAAEKNPKLKIGIISKVYPVRSHTVSAEGGIAGVLREYDSLEKHEYDTVKGSDFLADQDTVEFFVKEASKEIIQLEHWGCPWSREEDGRIAVRAFGGMSVKRTVFAADKTGFYMLHSLFERTLKYENIIRFDEFFVTRLFADGDRVTGCFAIDMRGGKFVSFSAKSMILATGGAGKIYPFTTNGNIKTGDGMALAYQIGAPLKDMEFVQFHPTGIPRTGILITEGARGEGGYLLNNKGERFMKNYLPEKMELGPRDIISRAITKEIKEGRGFKGPYGPYVHLDIRHLGEKLIDEKLPLVREISIDHAGIDPVHEPIPVMPVAHYFMGGVHTNIHTETPVKGLYAAGETACVTINGANRLGSNSLAECLVFGKVAGERATEFSEKNNQPNISENNYDEEKNRLISLLHRKENIKVSSVRDIMHKTMDENAGIERSQNGLEKGLDDIAHAREEFEHIGLMDQNLVFNTEFISMLELENMLVVAEAVLRSALTRQESRGSHFRTDFQKRDDEKFLKHLLIEKSERGMMVKDVPVTITKYPPTERKY